MSTRAKKAAADVKAEEKKVATKAKTTAKKIASDVKAEEKKIEKAVKAPAKKIAAAKLNLVIQSKMGGSITAEEVAAKIPKNAVNQRRRSWSEPAQTIHVESCA